MKKIVSLILIFAILFTGCATSGIVNKNEKKKVHVEKQSRESTKETIYTGLDDEKLQTDLKDKLYSGLVSKLDSEEYFVSEIESIYYPKEYIEAKASNNRKNVYFGFTAEELDKRFKGQKYVFTLGDNDETVVVPMKTSIDDTYIKAMENVLVGSGVILFCVTVTVLTAGTGAPASVSLVFAASAKDAAVMSTEFGTLSFVSAALVKGYETEDYEEAIRAGVKNGSEGFKFGAVFGALSGGGKAYKGLKKATLNGLTINEAAKIQKESKWSFDCIKNIHSMDEYEVYKNAGLVPTKMQDGKLALIRSINWQKKDKFGRTNIQRVKNGLSPIDAKGESYELHHIGMKADSPLAVLKKSEHHDNNKYKILHYKSEGKGVSDADWEAQRKTFWGQMLKMAEEKGKL